MNVAAAEYAIDSTTGTGGTFNGISGIAAGSTVTLTSVAIDSTVFNGLADGTHTLYIHGKDANGVWNPAWSTGLTFEKDTTAPTISSLSALPSPTSVPPTISATITASGTTNTIVSAEYFIDPTLPITPGSGKSLNVTASHTVTPSLTIPQADFNALGNSAHTVYVDALDAVGNWSTASQTSFTEAVPTSQNSTITFPANPPGAYSQVGWTGTISGTASETGGTLGSVLLSLYDNTTARWYGGSTFSSTTATTVTATGTTSWTYAFAYTKLTTGHSYTFTSMAKDSGGLVQSPGTAVTFTYVNVVPTSSISSSVIPTPTNTPPTFGGTASAYYSSVNIIAAEYAIDTKLGNGLNHSIAVTPAYSITWSSANSNLVHYRPRGFQQPCRWQPHPLPPCRGRRGQLEHAPRGPGSADTPSRSSPPRRRSQRFRRCRVPPTCRRQSA